MEWPTVDSFELLLRDAVCGVDSSLRSSALCDALQPAVGSIVADRYRVGALIGRGGMGNVYAAEHVLTGKQVALKWLRSDHGLRRDAALRMMREARSAGQIRHPNVVDVYDAGAVDGHPFIVMELIEGRSLEERLRDGPLEIGEAIECMLQVMRGVAAAHELSILHRDLKPANILLSPGRDREGVFAKVVDFGVSKPLRETDSDLRLTTRGMLVGTPVFMSPEQIRGDDLDERADVYALSVTLYHALTLRYPFEARSHGELHAKILTEAAVPITQHRPELPRALAQIIARGLAPERKRRFANVREMARELSSVTAATAGPLHTQQWPRRLRSVALATVAMTWLGAIMAAGKTGETWVLSRPQVVRAALPPITPVALASPPALAITALEALPSRRVERPKRRVRQAPASSPALPTAGERLMNW